jgi:Ser/Thr protein kinase RdoA (MazF antagonist)
MTVQYGPEVLADLDLAIRAALPLWSLSSDAEIRLLNVSENATYRVDDTCTGRSVLLRVHRLDYHETQEIRSEIDWIEALRAERAVETPAPLRGADGTFVQTLPSLSGFPTRSAVAFDFAPGQEPAADADLPGWFRTLGALTARMHSHARGWVPPEGFQRKTWDFDSMFGAQAYWGPWRAGVGLDAAGTALMDRALTLIRTRLERFGRSPERFGLIHADLRLANLIVDEPHLRVIDFDDCGLSWRLYDFAAAVSFFEHEPIVDELRDVWVEGYRSVTQLPQEDADELPIFIAMRRFLLVAWVASHPEVQIAQELGAGYTAGALTMAEKLLSRYA